MAAATAKIPMSRIFMCDNYEFGHSGKSVMNLSDTIFEFLDESSEEFLKNINSGEYDKNESQDGVEEKENGKNVEDDKAFWETQHQILHGILCRSSSLETRIRNATKEAIKEAPMVGNFCVCRRPVAGGCRNCLMREICSHLRNAGFNSAICKSKWRSSPDIPSGEHTFLDVVETSASKTTEVRVIIELNFRSEFEVARASEEYKQLTQKLPEVFVGKVERLHNLIKILCSAAKKCMRENKMHMGPWRKHRYMQAKWLTTAHERVTEAASLLPAVVDGWSGSRGHAAGPRTSMLTVDLLEINVPNLHMTAVEVV